MEPLLSESQSVDVRILTVAERLLYLDVGSRRRRFEQPEIRGNLPVFHHLLEKDLGTGWIESTTYAAFRQDSRGLFGS